MLQQQNNPVSPTPIAGDFVFSGTAYTGSWSESHRHDCEITELALMESHLCAEQIERIKGKRGADAAAQIKVDVMEKRRELIANGTIKVAAPKAKPAQGSGYGNNSRGSYSANRPGSAPTRAPNSNPF